jgi:endonuclease-3
VIEQTFLGSVRDDPLDTLIKTVLSQATNDRNSQKAFTSLKQAYPTWEQVALAPDEHIAQLIQVGGLGPQKARRIKAILASIKKQAGSYDLGFLQNLRMEQAWDLLMALEGVGPKTAACTLLFSFGMPFFPVDTHIHRIAKRLGLVPPGKSAENTQLIMQACVPADLVERLHINLIELGRTYCDARNPLCDECPLKHMCRRGPAERTAGRN